MIGLGLLVIKQSDNVFEIHKLSPWDLAMAKEKPDDYFLAAAENWKPDAVVDAAELEKIKNAKHGLTFAGKEPDAHELAADIIHVVNAKQMRLF